MANTTEHDAPKVQFLTTNEVATLMRVTPTTIRSWRKRQYGPTGWIKAGRKRLIPADRVAEWLAAAEQAVDIYAA